MSLSQAIRAARMEAVIRNPTSVRIVGRQITKSACLLAGYVYTKDTEGLRQLLFECTVNPFLMAWRHAWRFERSHRAVGPLQILQIWHHILADTLSPNDLITSILVPLGKLPRILIVVANFIVAMHNVIKSGPASCFPDEDDTSVEKYLC